MSVLKKIGAVALGTGSAIGWVAVNSLKTALQSAASKVGDGTYTASNGKQYTAGNYKKAAGQCNTGFFENGFKKAVELWKDDD